MDIGKANLLIFLVISHWQLKRNTVMPDLGWMEKLINGGKTTIDYVNLDFSCKVFFVLGMLLTLRQYLSPKLNKRPSPRTNKSPIPSFSFGRSYLKASSKTARKEWHRFRAYSPFQALRSWCARARTRCWVGAIARRNPSAHKSGNVSYWDFCRSPSGALPFSLTMRALLYLRSPNIYDSLQFFYNKHVHRRLNFLWCNVQSAQSSTEMTCLDMLHVSCSSYHQL